MDIAFNEIEKEFSETFGYVRQDIAELLKNDRPLHYTLALLVCCACEMLTWHRDLRDDQAHEIFTSLLPDSYGPAGKTLWEALRNGLAHKFRPDTIKVEREAWRFSISSQSRPSAPYVTVSKGQPNWIQLNIRIGAARVISQIDAYEEELRTSAAARLRFHEKSKKYIKTVLPEAVRIVEALRTS